MTESNSMLSKNIKKAFEKLRLERKEISKKKLIVLFVFINENEQCSPYSFFKQLDEYRFNVAKKYKEEDCIFIGPVNLWIGVKDKPKELKPAF